MNLFELVVLSFALSMDSFVASLCKGMEVDDLNRKNIILVSLFFSTFQSMMPILGSLFASLFGQILIHIDHWLSFTFLLYLGISNIKKTKEDVNVNPGFNLSNLILLSIAISIDAFTIGITYRVLGVSLITASISNFTITFITTYIGIKLGQFCGDHLQKKALTIGGILLIALGLKILLSHLNLF